MGSFSIWHWLIVLLVVVLIFGTKKLKNMGSDLGSAVHGFKQGVKGGEESAARDAEALTSAHKTATPSETVDVEARRKS